MWTDDEIDMAVADLPGRANVKMSKALEKEFVAMMRQMRDAALDETRYLHEHDRQLQQRYDALLNLLTVNLCYIGNNDVHLYYDQIAGEWVVMQGRPARYNIFTGDLDGAVAAFKREIEGVNDDT